MLLFLPAAAMVGAACIILLKARGTRRGSVPHCRECEYALVGITSDRCPECGADLGARNAVVCGERVRRRGLAASGIALGAIGALLLVLAGLHVVRGFDWYRLLPVGSLIDRLSRPSKAVQDHAWSELRRRMANSGLRQNQRARLVEQALLLQAGGAGGELLEWLGKTVQDGGVSEAQRDRFFRQALKVDLRVRPKLLQGDAIPFLVLFISRLPAEFTAHTADIRILRASLDGLPVRGAGEGDSMGCPLRGGIAGGSIGAWVACPTSGRHLVSVDVRVSLFARGTPMWPPNPKELYRRDVTLSASIEVLPQESTGDVTFLEDPSLAPHIHGLIALKHVAPEDDGSGLSATIDFAHSNVDLAFEVYVRADGREQHLGSVALSRGVSTTRFLYDPQITVGAAETVDVVFRSSEAAVRRTVRLGHVWKGELVYPNVRLESPLPRSHMPNLDMPPE